MFIAKQPLKLLENRVSRIYSGGFLLDCFLDKENQMDSHFPENWLGSTVVAKMSGGSHKGIEGQSQILTSSGQKLNLRSFLQENASEILGDSHIKKYGANPGVLVKLLDSAIRLLFKFILRRNLPKSTLILVLVKLKLGLFLEREKLMA